MTLFTYSLMSAWFTLHSIVYNDSSKIAMIFKYFWNSCFQIFKIIFLSVMEWHDTYLTEKHWSGRKSNTSINDQSINSQDKCTKQTASLESKTEKHSYRCYSTALYYTNQPLQNQKGSKA